MLMLDFDVFHPQLMKPASVQFIKKTAELLAKSIEIISCLSINDAFMMRAWKDNSKIGDEVLLLINGNLKFTEPIGT